MQFLKNLFSHHKMKMVWFLLFTLGFAVLNFPFGDISDRLTTEIAANTNNNVYLQFDDLTLSMIPQPALTMTNVVAESPAVSDVSMDELSIAPSILGLIRQKPQGRVTATNLFDGNLDISVGSSKKIKVPEAMSADVEFQDFEIKSLIKALQPNGVFSASGKGRLVASVDIDPNMKSQPDGNFDVQAQRVQIPSLTVPLPGMPGLNLPGLSLEKLVVKGKIQNGKLILNDSQLGSGKDDISARVTGEMDLRIFPGFSSVNVGFYNLAVDLTIKDSAKQKLNGMDSLIDGFLGKYRSTNAAGKRYAFRIQANGFSDPAPQFSPL